ncbi:MAG: DUF951 domain-containing protein, partial [Firmicutes bacterium]|nr:DUF951 domain-containing protein [Bacillota bacterium]
VGDVIRLRKVHPCGGDQWEVLRTGIDVRIRCLKCGRVLLLPRIKLMKSIRGTWARDAGEEKG